MHSVFFRVCWRHFEDCGQIANDAADLVVAHVRRLAESRYPFQANIPFDFAWYRPEEMIAMGAEARRAHSTKVVRVWEGSRPWYAQDVFGTERSVRFTFKNKRDAEDARRIVWMLNDLLITSPAIVFSTEPGSPEEYEFKRLPDPILEDFLVDQRKTAA